MRITDREAQTIKNAIHDRDPAAEIYLFGSRTDDTRRGGDIDILVISATLRLMDSVRIQTDLEETLGEMDIDIVIKRDKEEIFAKIVLAEGAIPL